MAVDTWRRGGTNELRPVLSAAVGTIGWNNFSVWEELLTLAGLGRCRASAWWTGLYFLLGQLSELTRRVAPGTM